MSRRLYKPPLAVWVVLLGPARTPWIVSAVKRTAEAEAKHLRRVCHPPEYVIVEKYERAG